MKIVKLSFLVILIFSYDNVRRLHYVLDISGPTTISPEPWMAKDDTISLII